MGIDVIQVKATAQLEAEEKELKGLSRYGNAVKGAVVKALKEFLSQSEEFARAVADNPGKLKDCIESTVKNCGSSISDNEVFSRAAAFYFPGSVIEFKMIIHMSKYECESTTEGGAISLDLDELFDI